MDSPLAPTASDSAAIAKIQAMITPDQVLSATAARRRRTITRRRTSSANKNRSQTPLRASLDSSTDDEDDASDLRPSKSKTPERPQRTVKTVSSYSCSDSDPKDTPDDEHTTTSKTEELKKSSDSEKEVPKTKPLRKSNNGLVKKTSFKATPKPMISDSESTSSNLTKPETTELLEKPKKVKRRPKITNESPAEQTTPIHQLNGDSPSLTSETNLKETEISEILLKKSTVAKETNLEQETELSKVLPKKSSKATNLEKEPQVVPKKSSSPKEIDLEQEISKNSSLIRKTSFKSETQSEPSDPQTTNKKPLRAKRRVADENAEDSKPTKTKQKTNLDRSSSIPRQFEEQLTKFDNFVSTNTKELFGLFEKAKTTVGEKGKELRRRRFRGKEVKRSQSTPRQLTEEDLLESFRRAQAATAQREKERSNSARRYSTGSESPERPARKIKQEISEIKESLLKGEEDAKVVDEEVKAVKKKIKSNKIIEILDPKTSKVIARKNVGVVAHMGFFDALKIFKFYSPRQIRNEYKKYKLDFQADYKVIRCLRKKCFSHLLLLLIFCGLGGIVFKLTEGSFENFYKCGVKRVKRDFVDQLWVRSHNLREEEWKSIARNKLRIFEDELHAAHEAGVHSYSGQRSWSFLNGIVYCLTIVTTIGYGHLYPTTTTGQALTIVYSLIGIPLFLIILTDFGKLFTRCIKFLWSFVRRLYYTGSCKSVRKTAQVQEIFKGAQYMYDIARFRRPSAYDRSAHQAHNQSHEGTEGSNTAPPTPAISNFEIDDEFNLPISVAILLLVLYIFLGAVLFGIWEGWDFFASFYFVFISMSTIGFGDYVPRHPIFMIVSIVYLVFGLALMSMCINVVQVKLSNTFSQASAKIGATIGLGVAEEDGSILPVPPKAVEMPQVHGSLIDINVNPEVNGPNTSKSFP